VLPRTGIYPELLPKSMHGFCLYDVEADSMASRLQDALYGTADIPGTGAELDRILHQFDLISVCKAMDERLSEIAEAHGGAHRAPAAKATAPTPKPPSAAAQPPTKQPPAPTTQPPAPTTPPSTTTLGRAPRP
jgi:hypothetical protein